MLKRHNGFYYPVPVQLTKVASLQCVDSSLYTLKIFSLNSKNHSSKSFDENPSLSDILFVTLWGKVVTFQVRAYISPCFRWRLVLKEAGTIMPKLVGVILNVYVLSLRVHITL